MQEGKALQKFEVNSSKLLEILRVSQSIIDKKIDIDGSKAQFQIRGDTCTLIASDGSMYMHGVIQISQEHVLDMDFCISISVLYDLVRRLDDDTIEFIVFENSVKIKYKKGNFNLLKTNTIFAQTIPENKVGSFRIKPYVLSDTLKAVRSTVANEDIRHQFKGVMLICDEDIVFWSTDGHKLSLCKADAEHDSQEFKVILPRKFVDSICLISFGDLVEINVYEKFVEYINSNITIISPLINANILDYKNIVNESIQSDFEILCDSNELIKELDRIMIVTDESQRVALKIENDKCFLQASNVNDGESFEELTVMSKTGGNFNISFNGATILSFLRNLKGEVNFVYYERTKTIMIKKNTYPIYITKALKDKSVEFYQN